MSLEEVSNQIEESGIDKRIIIAILRIARENSNQNHTQQDYYNGINRLGKTFKTDLGSISIVQKICYDGLGLIVYDEEKEKTFLTEEGKKYLELMEREK